MRKTFDIKNQMVLEYLKSQHNQTKYIIDLILADMNRTPKRVNKQEIIEIIKEYLSETGKIQKDEATKNAILNILDMRKQK